MQPRVALLPPSHHSPIVLPRHPINRSTTNQDSLLMIAAENQAYQHLTPKLPNSAYYYDSEKRHDNIYSSSGSPSTFNTQPFSRDSCSDADSGILADNLSDSTVSSDRTSPTQRYGRGLFRKKNFKPLPNLPSASQLIKKQMTILQDAAAVCQSPTLSQSSSASSLENNVKRTKPRVHFADEKLPPQRPSAENNRAKNSSHHTPTIDSKNNSINMQDCRYQSLPRNLPSGQVANHIRGQNAQANRRVASQSPPPYDAACARLKQMRVTPQGATRNNLQYYYYTTDDCNTYAADNIRAKSNEFLNRLGAAKSVDNLHAAVTTPVHAPNFSNYSDIPGLSLNISNNSHNSCVMPAGSCDNITSLTPEKINLPIQRKKEKSFTFGAKMMVLKQANRRANSAERPTQKGPIIAHQNLRLLDNLQKQFTEIELADRNVRIKLLSLDCKGIQVVELEREDKGPFGFFIATGTFKKKKGIFISRVTARSLVPLLSTGDEILDVDSIPVRGRNLEQVQQLIASKQRIILRLLPALIR